MNLSRMCWAVRGGFAVLSGLLLLNPAWGENVVWTEAEPGEPGEILTFVIKATTGEIIGDSFVNFSFDPALFEYVGRDFSFSPLAELAESYGGREEPEAGDIAIRYVMTANDNENLFPPTEDFEIARISLRVRSRTAPGVYAVGAVEQVDSWVAETSMTRGGQHVEVRVIPGEVTVVAPTRPLPPAELVCTRTAATATLEWENLASYTKVVIERDGETVAELPPGAESFTDENAGHEERTYRVRGYMGERASFPVQCTVPSAELALAPVERLTCEEGSSPGWLSLSWIASAEYDGIEIRRNGELIASLEGNATTYLDRFDSEGKLILYEVIGYTGDLESAPAPCQVNGSWVVRVGSVTARPGEKGVEVPMYVSNPWPVPGFSLIMEFEPSAYRVSGVSYEGTLLEQFRPFLEVQREGDNYFLTMADFVVPGPQKTIKPGLEICFLKFVLDISPEAEEGEIFPLRLVDGYHNPPANNILVAYVNYGGAASIRPEKIDGELVIGAPPVEAVEDLRANPRKNSTGFTLQWENGGFYDVVEVERNGVPVATLPGNSTRFSEDLTSPGVYWYRVRGIKGGYASPWSVITYPYLPGVNLFRRGDANSDGKIDIADAVAVLDYLWRQGEAGCLDAADTNDDGKLDVADPIYLLSYLFVSQAPPPSPGPHIRWIDPTADVLTCEEGTP